MEMKRHLETLAQKDPDLRRQALADVLDAEGLSYCLQEDGPNFKNPRGTVNYILDPWQDAPSLLFCAHYDAVPGSFGANDNAAALCILIDLAKDLKEKGNRLFRKQALCVLSGQPGPSQAGPYRGREPGRMRVRRYHCHLRQGQ